ncbi:hypothetical protein [Spirosoma endophyticum]|uniref:Uncharacterized protein n=1 Tax=Spirosoma endophyticum TaxID=662367 RepID=A0A1I2GGM9_9BACT|nr:hypothetical protein [Spirosoma endophyticum]SFF16353.1 hypothetical protein SAMN05216167_13214 [Spirosoma endophyticum]
MRTNLKCLVTLFTLATALTLVSCQPESIDSRTPTAKKIIHPTLADGDDDQPPKTGWPGGN